MYDVEKKKFVSASTSDFLGASPEDEIVRPLPFEALVYQLTQLFHCRPSEILEEDNELIMKILTVHNIYGKLDEWRIEWEKKKLSAQLGIALELEKLKTQ